MRANNSLIVFRMYEFLRRRGGHVSDFELVKRFNYASSDEIFFAKCLLADYEKKHPLLADRKCLTKRKNRTNFNTSNKKVNDG